MDEFMGGVFDVALIVLCAAAVVWILWGSGLILFC